MVPFLITVTNVDTDELIRLVEVIEVQINVEDGRVGTVMVVVLSVFGTVV